jgi:hypothetical protein
LSSENREVVTFSYVLVFKQIAGKILDPTVCYLGPAVAQLVEALRYKLEGREFDSRLCH